MDDRGSKDTAPMTSEETSDLKGEPLRELSDARLEGVAGGTLWAGMVTICLKCGGKMVLRMTKSGQRRLICTGCGWSPNN